MEHYIVPTRSPARPWTCFSSVFMRFRTSVRARTHSTQLTYSWATHVRVHLFPWVESMDLLSHLPLTTPLRHDKQRNTTAVIIHRIRIRICTRGVLRLENVFDSKKRVWDYMKKNTNCLHDLWLSGSILFEDPSVVPCTPSLPTWTYGILYFS